MARPLVWGVGVWGEDTWGVAIPTLPRVDPDAPWRPGPATSQLLITKPGEHTAKTLDAGGVAMAWQVSGQTSLSAEVRTADLLENFVDASGNPSLDLRAYWLRWEHPTLGVWAGEISNVEASYSSGTSEIAAKDFSALLDSRRLAKVYDIRAAPAGGFAKRIVFDAGRDTGGYTWIRNIYAEETGDPITLTLRGGQVGDALRTMAGRSGDEWWVDEQRQLWWQRRRGSNKTATVVLVEGRHIVDHSYSLALDPVVNDLRVIPADKQYTLTESFIIDNDASIAAIGRRQGDLTYTGFVTESTLRPLAAKDLKRLLKLGDAITFDVADVDGCWQLFREGDSILLRLPSVNRLLQVRVLVRSFDTERPVLRVSGEVES